MGILENLASFDLVNGFSLSELLAVANSSTWQRIIYLILCILLVLVFLTKPKK